MIITINSYAGSIVSLDLRDRLGDRVELDCFQFVVTPIEFRLVRKGAPIQDWQAGNTEMYDLQHPSGAREWSRDNHRFSDQLQRRSENITCGVLCEDLGIETRGLSFPIALLVWPRENTCRGKASTETSLPIL